MQVGWGDYFLFGSIFIKKISKPEFFFKKKPKLIQTGLTRFWLGFFQFGLVFSVWLGFFLAFIGLGSIWFFQFQACKTETESNQSTFLKFESV